MGWFVVARRTRGVEFSLTTGRVFVHDQVVDHGVSGRVHGGTNPEGPFGGRFFRE